MKNFSVYNTRVDDSVPPHAHTHHTRLAGEREEEEKVEEEDDRIKHIKPDDLVTRKRYNALSCLSTFRERLGIVRLPRGDDILSHSRTACSLIY